MKNKAPITIVIADDYPIVRKGLRDVIESDGALRIVAEAGDGSEALDIVRCIRCVHGGDYFICSSLAGSLVQGNSTYENGDRVPDSNS